MEIYKCLDDIITRVEQGQEPKIIKARAFGGGSIALIDLNKLLAVEDANRFKRLGRFDEFQGWNVDRDSIRLKKEIPNISFSSFKNPNCH